MVTRLKLKRVMSGEKQWKIAQKAGICQVELSHYEVGRRIPTYDRQMILAKVLNCKREDIFPEECEKEKKQFNKSCSRF